MPQTRPTNGSTNNEVLRVTNPKVCPWTSGTPPISRDFDGETTTVSSAAAGRLHNACPLPGDHRTVNRLMGQASTAR